MFVKLRQLMVPLFNHQMIRACLWSSGGIILTEENRRTKKKTVPVPFYLIQIPHTLTWVWIWVSAVRSRRLTAPIGRTWFSFVVMLNTKFVLRKYFCWTAIYFVCTIPLGYVLSNTRKKKIFVQVGLLNVFIIWNIINLAVV